MKSEIIKKLLEEMANEHWTKRFKRWIRLKIWVYTCLSRPYWDKTFSGYIFKKRKR